MHVRRRPAGARARDGVSFSIERDADGGALFRQALDVHVSTCGYGGGSLWLMRFGNPTAAGIFHLAGCSSSAAVWNEPSIHRGDRARL